MVVAGSLAASSGTLRLPAFVSTFPSVSATTSSNSARPVLSFASPVIATHVYSASTNLSSSLLPPSVDRAFVVGPGHAPIPAKLILKITSSQFVDLTNLLSANLRTAEQEPRTFLDGKLVVSKKRQVVKIQDILTWTEAFTIFQMVMCTTHTHCWPDLAKYKLLIIQTARQSPSRAWLEYDLAFRKDVAATGASDWSKMNLSNVHLQSPVPIHSLQILLPLPCQQARATSLTPLTASCGTMGSAACPSGNATTTTSAVHVIGTTPGLTAPFIPAGSFTRVPLPL